MPISARSVCDDGYVGALMPHVAMELTMTETLRYLTVADAARAAIDVQDACNASGVALSMFDAARTLRNAAGIPDLGPEWTGGINRHPVMQLFAYKLAALCIVEPMDTANQDIYTNALHACGAMVDAQTA
jgi:hypothetical protein